MASFKGIELARRLWWGGKDGVHLGEDELERDLEVQSLQGWEERSVSRDAKDSAGFPAWFRAPSGPLGTEDHRLWCLEMPELPCQGATHTVTYSGSAWVPQLTMAATQ